MTLNGKLITIFGGGGFLGRYISQHLLREGARLRIAERDPKNAKHIKPLGNLGQVQFAGANICKPETVARAVQGSDAVINLVGILKGDFDKVHREGAANVAKAAAAAGVYSLLHMSAIGADAQSPSAYGRSKAQGEEAAHKAFPGAIIMRPSIVFGREDEFINRFAGMIAALPIIPVIGADTKFQPIYVGDVALAVTAALSADLSGSQDVRGRILELGGPEIVTMGALNQRIARITRREPVFINMPGALAKAMAMLTGFLPGAPITLDQFKMLERDNIVAKGASGLEQLGISPRPLASCTHGWLTQYRKFGRFGARSKSRA